MLIAAADQIEFLARFTDVKLRVMFVGGSFILNLSLYDVELSTRPILARAESNNINPIKFMSSTLYGDKKGSDTGVGAKFTQN